jgi:trans-2,3-dihydro-3-hydroxyanthranilate isomerase
VKVTFRDLAVFTRDGSGGNPLAVIDHASVPSARWQAVARAIGYSETVFVEEGAVATLHIYTPERRLPFAGHPLVGTAFALGESTHTLRYDAGSAIVSREGSLTHVRLTHESEGYGVAPPDFAVAARLIEMPLPYLVVEVADPGVVAGIEADDVAELKEKIYVWAWEEPGKVVRARFFAPGVGVPEDAATGSAAVALARVLDDDRGSLTIHQGEEIGRPSQIELAWEGTRVTIGGTVTDHGHREVVVD